MVCMCVSSTHAMCRCSELGTSAGEVAGTQLCHEPAVLVCCTCHNCHIKLARGRLDVYAITCLVVVCCQCWFLFGCGGSGRHAAVTRAPLRQAVVLCVELCCALLRRAVSIMCQKPPLDLLGGTAACV
jgi:hypothetical protein